MAQKKKVVKKTTKRTVCDTCLCKGCINHPTCNCNKNKKNCETHHCSKYSHN